MSDVIDNRVKSPPPLEQPIIRYRVRGTDAQNDIWEFYTISRVRALETFRKMEKWKLRSPAIICGTALFEAHTLERLP